MKNWMITALTVLAHYGLVTAQITFSPNHNISICGPTTVYFVYNKIVDPDLLYWDFGDGSTSTLINPAHYYDSIGVFDVKLVVIKGNQRDSLIKHNMIEIKPTPLAGFSKTLLTQSPTPSGFEYEFVNLSVHQADSFNEQLWTINNDSLKGYTVRYTFANNGKYAVNLRVTNNKGCSANYSDTITIGGGIIEPPTGVSQNHNDFKINVFPNPANNIIQINHPQQKHVYATLYNLLGEQQQATITSTNYHTNIQTAHLPEGVYVLTINNGNKQLSKRITIMH